MNRNRYMARKELNSQNGGKPAVSAIASLEYPAKRKSIPLAGLGAQGTIERTPRLRFEDNPDPRGNAKASAASPW